MRKTALALAALVAAFPALADDGVGTYYPKLGAFRLSNSEAIEMTEEVVDIWNERVSVTFTFTNLTSSPQTVTLGFPVLDFPQSSWSPGREEEPRILSDKDFAEIEAFYAFTSRVGGRALPRKLVRDGGSAELAAGEPVYWFVSTLDFKPGEVLRVTDSYRQVPDSFGDSMGGEGYNLSYILVSGASWAGSIRKATLRYHTRDREAFEGRSTFSFTNVINRHASYEYSLEPTDLAWDEGRGEGLVTWEFTDLEPRQNLDIHYYSRWQDFEPADIAWGLLQGKGLLDGSSGTVRSFAYSDYAKDDPFAWSAAIARGLSKEEFAAGLEEFYAAYETKPRADPKVAAFARYLVNALHALHGYRFKDSRWAEIFAVFPWYEPRVDTVGDFSARELAMITTLSTYR